MAMCQKYIHAEVQVVLYGANIFQKRSSIHPGIYLWFMVWYKTVLPKHSLGNHVSAGRVVCNQQKLLYAEAPPWIKVKFEIFFPLFLGKDDRKIFSVVCAKKKENYGSICSKNINITCPLSVPCPIYVLQLPLLPFKISSSMSTFP